MSRTKVGGIVEQMSGVINKYLTGNFNYFTSDEIGNTITFLQNIQDTYSDDDDADILLGYISQIKPHLYVAEGLATIDLPRDIEYYRNMEAARNLFRQIKSLR
ncbi:MAG: hypothetical protein AB1750_15340 [Chloroflexota bacterium]